MAKIHGILELPSARPRRQPRLVSSSRRPAAKTAEEAQQVAVGIGNDELPVAGLDVALPIPALLERYMERQAGPLHSRMEVLDVGNLDLEI